MTDSLTAIAVGDSGISIRTTDGGASWESIASMTRNTLHGIVFSDALVGTMVGGGGTILRTTSGGLPLGMERLAHPALPSDFRLDQNYPNPFNGSTTIQFAVSVRARVNLSVYDMLGRHVAALVEEELSPGVYRVSFGSEELSSGVYFSTLSAEGLHVTRKILYLK